MLKHIPVIVGPTAVGKTGVSVCLAEKIGAEVISADSMQVYKYLSIGTAKPTVEELNGIPYHLIDHVDPHEQYNLGRFIAEADQQIEDLRKREKSIIVCGGTGLYIRGLTYGVFDGGAANPQIREALDREYRELGLQHLFEELQRVDPGSAANYGSNDKQRIMRALEIYRLTAKPFSSTHTQDFSRPRLPVITFYLRDTRSRLYDRINRRVDSMVSLGLIEEVTSFVSRFGEINNPALSALGYREIIKALKGELPMDDALSAMKQKSRNYAKRQETWFRSIKDAVVVDVESKSAESIANEIAGHIENY